MPPIVSVPGVAENFKKVSVSFPKSMLAQAKKERAPNKGEFSDYLQRLVALDLKNESVGTTRDDIMEYLTDRLCGERYVLRIRPLLQGINQPDELERVLKLYIDSGGLTEQKHRRFGAQVT
jgi:hypothetical protein